MIQEFLTQLLKIGLAISAGALVGFERESQDKPAGLRDVILVTLGATIFSILALDLVRIASQFQLPIRYDIGRIIAYTIASMGFLGSGIIIQNKNKIEGLTTAGILWVMVGTGLVIGIGNYPLALALTLCVYGILKLKHVRIVFEKRRKREKRKIRNRKKN